MRTFSFVHFSPSAAVPEDVFRAETGEGLAKIALEIRKHTHAADQRARLLVFGVPPLSHEQIFGEP